jgi:hypothetical protein
MAKRTDNRACALFNRPSSAPCQQKNNPVGFGAQEKNPQNLKPIHLPDRVDFWVIFFLSPRRQQQNVKARKKPLPVDTMSSQRPFIVSF